MRPCTYVKGISQVKLGKWYVLNILAPDTEIPKASIVCMDKRLCGCISIHLRYTEIQYCDYTQISTLAVGKRL